MLSARDRESLGPRAVMAARLLFRHGQVPVERQEAEVPLPPAGAWASAQVAARGSPLPPQAWAEPIALRRCPRPLRSHSLRSVPQDGSTGPIPQPRAAAPRPRAAAPWACDARRAWAPPAASSYLPPWALSAKRDGRALSAPTRLQGRDARRRRAPADSVPARALRGRLDRRRRSARVCRRPALGPMRLRRPRRRGRPASPTATNPGGASCREGAWSVERGRS